MPLIILSIALYDIFKYVSFSLVRPINEELPKLNILKIPILLIYVNGA